MNLTQATEERSRKGDTVQKIEPQGDTELLESLVDDSALALNHRAFLEGMKPIHDLFSDLCSLPLQHPCAQYCLNWKGLMTPPLALRLHFQSQIIGCSAA